MIKIISPLMKTLVLELKALKKSLVFTKKETRKWNMLAYFQIKSLGEALCAFGYAISLDPITKSYLYSIHICFHAHHLVTPPKCENKTYVHIQTISKFLVVLTTLFTLPHANSCCVSKTPRVCVSSLIKLI